MSQEDGELGDAEEDDQAWVDEEPEPGPDEAP